MLPIAFFCFGPILILLWQSYSLDAHHHETFQFVFTHIVPSLFSNTLSLVALTCIGSVALGMLAAFLTQLTNLPGKKYFDFLFIVPLAFPLYVLSFIYVGSLEFSAPLMTFFREHFDLNLHPYIPIKSVFGVAAVFSLGLYPYTYLFVRSGLQRNAGKMIVISRGLGQKNFKTLFKILIPYLRPWLIASLVITAMETLADFGGVSAFNFNTFTTAIYSAWSGMFSLPTAARLSTLLVFIALIFFTLEWKFTTKRQFSFSRFGSEALELYQYRLFGKVITLLVASIILFFSLLFPLYQLINWSLQVYPIEWGPQYYQLITNTLKIGLYAALCATLISFLMVSIKRIHPSPLNSLLSGLSLLGYSLPGNIIAVAAFIFFSYLMGYHGQGLWLLVIALIIRFIAVSYRAHESSFKSISPGTEAAARTLGASDSKIIGRVHFPLMYKSLFLGGILVFLEVIKEMPITVMLRPFDHNTLSVKIYELTVEGEWERAALGSLFLVTSGIISALIYARFGSGK